MKAATRFLFGAALLCGIVAVADAQVGPTNSGGSSGGTPGGSPGQVQFNNSGSFGGFTMGGDATLDTSTGVLTIGSGKVGYSKIQSVTGSKLLGNATGSPAAPSEVGVGAGLTFSGGNLSLTAPYTVNTVSASIASFSGMDIFNGSGLTATFPGTVTFGANSTAGVVNINASTLTISNGQPVSGLADATKLHNHGFYQYLGSGTQAYAIGFPGFDTVTANALTKFSDSSGATTASTVVDNAGLVTVGTPTACSGGCAAGSINAQNLYVNGVAVGTGGNMSNSGSPVTGNLAKFSDATHVTNADLSGDVTTSGTTATTIGAGKVTYSKIQNGAINGLLGVNNGGAPTEVTIGTNLTLSGGVLSAGSTGGTWTAAQTFNSVYGSENDQSGTTYTLVASDCGKTVAFSNASAVTVTIPASIVPAAGTTCNIAIRQDGAGQVSVTGTAVTAATLVSAHSYTKTFGAHAVIGLELTTISATATAVLTGDGA